jgi:choline kinase
LIAVVLAAGSGRRLQPLTETVPKCLLEIAGRTLLDRTIEDLAAAGLDRAVIVTGHLSREVETHLAGRTPLDLTFVRNVRYDTTNNAASLLVARDAIDGHAFILCDADVIASANPFPSLVGHPGECVLAVDVGVPWDAEAMKVALAPDRSVRRISKRLAASESAGESIGLQKVGAGVAAQLWDAIGSLVSLDAALAYYEDAFQLMIDRGIRFDVSPVLPGSWMEIDDAADLAAARERFHA